MVITPDEIRRKAARSYHPLLQAWLRGEAFVPLTFSVGKLPGDFNALRTAVQVLQAQAKEGEGGRGYRLIWRTQQKRALGTQTLPTRVVFETFEDVLYLIGKEEEFARFQHDVQLIRQQVPQLENWMQRSPRKVIEHSGNWSDLLAVCRYFREHPRPGLYIRELPIAVHTKFVEQHAGILRELLDAILPPEAITADTSTFLSRFGLRERAACVRVRFLDRQLERRYHLPLSDISTPYRQLAGLDLGGDQRCLITENEMVFLTLPSLPDTFALWGGGFRVNSLADIPWLCDCPIAYWGDLDAQGFQILSQLRALFPQVISLMMDSATLETHADFCVQGTPCPVGFLPYITPEEQALFQHLARTQQRLEQERISHTYALARIHEFLEA